MGKQKQALQMRSWDDWFDNCNQLVPSLTAYEDELWKYYEQMYSPKRENERFQAYADVHDSGFYKTEPVLPKWRMIQTLVVGLPILVLAVIVSLVVLMMTQKIAPAAGAPKAILIGAIVYVLACGLMLGFFALKIQKIRANLSKLELAMSERLSYIPPRYRNSIAVHKLYDLFVNYPGVLTYNQAVYDLDAWFASMPRTDNYYIGQVISVMHDLEQAHTGLKGDAMDDASRELYRAPHQNPAMANPSLPNDIQSRTFKGVDNPDEKLQSLIGLESVKAQVRQMKNRMKFYSSGGGRAERVSGNHMCFIGSPGTGKTTVARIMTRILYDFGYIRENKCVEIDGNYLKSAYVGDTTKRTQAILDYAAGGVLFIDEAYLLLDGNKAGAVGAEALGALLKGIEDHASEIVVIFAGYEDAMNRLLASNEGFDSRIKYKIYFEDFSLDELMAIFKYDMEHYSKNGVYKLDPEAVALLRKSFEDERSGPSFGNARIVRNALDMILDIHADHYMNGLIAQNKRFLLTKEDVASYVSVREHQLNEDMRNYIARQNVDGEVISFAELKSRTKNGSSDPDKNLAEMAGLPTLKNEIQKMKAQFSFYNGNMGKNEGYHMCFMGAPGTGKSTVAGIMTGYLYKMGIIRRNEYLDINGDFLRGMYLGHTGKRTEAIVKYCRGMVLFLDEAYLLQQDDQGDKFGQEAIGVLIDAMEKHRKEFVVIVAGYDREMKAFLAANSGMQSRISMTFHFESYSPHELAQMMNRLARKDGFTVERDVWVPLQRFLQEQRENPYFGNGRYVRSFWQELKQAHIVRYSAGTMVDEARMRIDREDLAEAMRSMLAKQVEMK